MLKMDFLRLGQRAFPEVLRRYQSTVLKPMSEIPGPKRIPILGNFLNLKTGINNNLCSCNMITNLLSHYI